MLLIAKLYTKQKNYYTCDCFPKLFAEIIKKLGNSASVCYFFDENFFKIPNRGRVGGLAFDDGWEPSTCENIKQNKNMSFIQLHFIPSDICISSMNISKCKYSLSIYSCSYHVIRIWCLVVESFLWLAWNLLPDTRKIRQVHLTVFDVIYKLSFSQSTCVYSALEAVQLCAI